MTFEQKPCVLCAARDNEPYRLVHKDDLVFVCMNFEPLKPGHVMILPTRHVERLKDLLPDEAAAFLKATDACLAAAADAYGEESMCLVNGWKHRTQAHLHAHVIPSKHDMRRLYVAAEGVPERVRRTEEELSAMTDAFKNAFTI